MQNTLKSATVKERFGYVEPSWRKPELRKRQADSKWIVWVWKRRPEMRVPDDTLKLWQYSRYWWVPAGVFGSKYEALKWLGWAK